MYRLNYQYTHDIDWFCKVRDLPVHLASNGGRLPRLSYTIKNLVALQHKVANLNQSFHCSVNTRYLEGYIQQGEFYDSLDEMTDSEYRQMLPERFEMSNEVGELSRPLLLYSWSFIEMARRGFYSFDRDERTDTYHLVAWPKDFDLGIFDKDVYESLKQYWACCFPPRHRGFDSDLLEHITFDVDSFNSFYL